MDTLWDRYLATSGCDMAQCQRDLFIKNAKELEDESYTAEYCLKHLRVADDIWDMRNWRKAHDRKEVEAWVASNTEGDGHAGFCVSKLIKAYGVAQGKIIDAIMANKNMSWQSRIVPCFLVECPKWAKNGRKYNNNICDDCNKPSKKGKR